MVDDASVTAVRYTMYDMSGGRHKLIYVLANRADPGIEAVREEFFMFARGSRTRYRADAPIEREEIYN